ncbi:MAG: hypothetical protein WCL34_14255 [Methylococcaceae bacterium]
MTVEITIDGILNNPTTSEWLKSSLRGALVRDPLDVTNDAEMLFIVLSVRLGELFANHAPPVNDCIPL